MHQLKVEVPAIMGAVKELDWDSESKRIVAVGDGKPAGMKCFIWDTGSSAGEMLGHAKRALTVAYKPTRPFRIITGAEDQKIIFFAGPPFKLEKSDTATHQNFVNCVRYAPNGERAASCGSDKRIAIFDGQGDGLLYHYLEVSVKRKLITHCALATLQ